MALAITLLIFSIIGVIYGIKYNNKTLTIVSSIFIVMVVSVWIYFYCNPY